MSANSNICKSRVSCEDKVKFRLDRLRMQHSSVSYLSVPDHHWSRCNPWQPLHWVQFFFGAQVLIFCLSCYHLPCICNNLELESVMLHGICYILAWLLCTVHGICYIWPCSPSILHGVCHVLALQPLICVVFATFWYFKRSCGFLESFFRLSFRVSFRVSCRVSLGFLWGFI